MCGVVASLTQDVGLALHEIRHRGTRWSLVDGMGHARLPIVGLGDEHDQPVRRGRWLIGWVGEILDFRDRDPGAACDTDLVVRTWTAYGARGFREFDGFWSVVAIDKDYYELHILCDYLAQKPMYYRSDTASCASELWAMHKLGPTLTFDEIYMASVVKWGYCPEPWRTPYQEVRKVLPGEHVILRLVLPPQTEVVDRLQPVSVSPSELKEAIEAAVRRRVLSSDVPVAALVSGGLDSAITYTLAKRWGDVRPYHVENDEGPAFEKVVGPKDWIKACSIDLQDVMLSRGLDYMQEPIDLGSLLPQVALSDAIAGKETVVLTGDGADEFWGGYSRASRYDSQASDVWHELVCWHLPRLDRVMMRNCLEVRSPFLARRVAGAALATPWSLRQDKGLIRMLFRNDLPAGIADQPKKALRTKTVEDDREARSRALVFMFRKLFHQKEFLDGL